MSVFDFLYSRWGFDSKLSLLQAYTQKTKALYKKNLFIFFTANQIYEMEMEIPKPAILEQRVFNIPDRKEFERTALEVFRFQYANNLLYRDYCDALKKTPVTVRDLVSIPFLPILFFKTRRVET